MTFSSTVYATFIGDNTTDAFVINTFINKAADLKVYIDQVLQTSGYTVTIDAATPSATVTFATAPATGKKILIYRHIVSDFTDFLKGAPITSDNIDSGINQNQYASFDNKQEYDRFYTHYPIGSLEDGTGPSTAQLEFPLPTNPGIGESNYVMAWTGTKWVSEANNQDGVSAAELQASLADSSSDSEGAAEVGYNGDSTTVKGQLDIFRETATGENASGSAYITVYNVKTSTPQSVQAVFNALMKDATSATNSGAYYLSYWDGDGNKTIQQALDSRRSYGIGDYIAGLPFENPQTGSWLTIKASDTLGSAASTATKKSDDYQDLYVFMKVHYEGETEANAIAAFTANTVLQPSAMSSNPVAGVNTWRYA